jgi:septum formation protein
VGGPRRKVCRRDGASATDLIISFRDRGREGKNGFVLITPARPLVLGSASPRRREMIAMLGVPAVIRAAQVDESQQPGEAPEGYLERVTRTKLDAIRGSSVDPREAAGVLVADTIVVAPSGNILGKPADEDDARAMIDRLAGVTHVVSTRFVLAKAHAEAPIAHAQTVTTRVTFRALFPDEARAYAATGEGRDKAGAYAVQGRAAAFVERIEGSYTNVVGLPLSEVVVAMRALGWL